MRLRLFQADTSNNHPLTISGSIIAGNTASGSGPDFLPDSGSTLTVTSSLIGDNSGTTLTAAPVGSPDGNGNLIGTSGNLIDPLLGTLSDDEGPTLMHLPALNSPAVDAVTFRGTATQSSLFFGDNNFAADKAIDGDVATFSHTENSDDEATWTLDLGAPTLIDEVLLVNRVSSQSRLRDITVEILDAADTVLFTTPSLLNPENVLGGGQFDSGPASLTVDLTTPVTGQKIRVSRTPDPDLSGAGGPTGGGVQADQNVLSLAEVFVRSLDQRGTPRQQGIRPDMGAVERVVFDFGDAPDAGSGTGPGNYETLAASGGPSHQIISGLRLGANVDHEEDATPSTAANGNDVDVALPDDEDGVLSPLDLVGTIGAAPTVTLLVTNTTGTDATLSGWIDYNQDGVFDNATERAQVDVPDGSGDQRVTLTFPAINASASTGTTYARFRLSTDAAGQNSTGAATDGEVEDYVFTITAPNRGTVESFLKITSDTTNGPTLADGDAFGRSVTAIGDIDGDGVVDLAVGANGDDTGGGSAGAVHVLRMNADGSVKGSTKIADETNGGPVLVGGDYFGTTVSSIGDVDGDGVPDLAVGAFGDDTGGTFRGAVYVLFLKPDGTAKSFTKIADGTGGLPADTLVNRDFFGQSVSSPGDLDGDGVPDLAVGARGDDTGGDTRGAVHILRLNADGTVKSSTKIAHETNGGPTLADGDALGRSVAAIGDVNGDGVPDLAAGASLDDTGGTDRGAIHVLLLNADGSVQSSAKIAHETGGGPTLADGDNFGFDVASIGDVDGDGVPDLAAGTYTDSTGNNRGTVQVLLLNENGTAKAFTKIAHQTGGGPTLANDDFFGITLSSVGDLNGDGRVDLAVGASGDDTGGSGRGAVHVLFLDEAQADFGDAPDTSGGTGAGNYRTTAADNGPSHGSREGFGLRLGANIDGEFDATPNAAANGDDVANPQPDAGFQFDDEDGVLNPLDLRGTVGNAPSVTLLVTNTTGTAATLSGWIDYNQDGDFDNATERAQIVIPDGSTDARVTLTFPAITAVASTGTTYARFRLSTDAAGQNSTGAALDGEVEDYAFEITAPSSGTVDSFLKIADETNGGPDVAAEDRFGSAVANIGDLDGDGVTDLAVGADDDDTGGNSRGAVHVLLLNSDGSVKSSSKIADNTGGGPALANFDYFGSSVTSLGDLDGDGVTDLAVGARGDDTGGNDRGAMHVLLLNSDGTVKASTKIAHNTGGGPNLADGDRFGVSVSSVGDLDGDGVADLAVGASYDDTGGTGDALRGAVHVLLLNADGTAKASTKIAHQTGGGPELADQDLFGVSVAGLGDLNNDGIPDLAVGAFRDGVGGTSDGAVHVLFLDEADTTPPTVNVSLDDSALRIGETATVTFTFSEDPVGFAANDVTAQNGALSAFTVTGDPLIFTATFTPTADIEDATNVISVGTGYTDAAGNSGTAGASANYTIDTLAPTVAVTLDDSALIIGGTATVTFTFSEAPTGFAAGDVTAQNGNLSAFTATGNPLIFTATFTPTADTEDATNVISVGTTYTDTAGNAGTAGASANYTIDTLAPTVAVTLDDSALKIGDTATVTFSFSEAPTGFAAGDVTAPNGNLSGLVNSGDPRIFIATFTPTADIEDATNVISVGTGYTDEAGNTGTAGASANYAIDTLAPTVAVTLDDSSLTIGETATVTVTFSEAPVGFASVTAQNGALSPLQATGDARIFTATFTPTADLEDATNVINVGTGYADAAGNAGAAGVSANYAIDTLAPTVTITPDGTTTTDSPIVFTFQFSEAVSGFVVGDVSLTNGSAGTFTPVDADTFTLEVTPASPGTVTASLAADVAQDALGNGNTSGSASVTSSAAGDVALPAAGTFEILLDGGDLVVRTAGGAEQFRRVAASVTVLEIAGTSGDDVLTVLGSGGAVSTPILFTGEGGDDLFDASLATGSTTLIGGAGDDTLTGGTVDDFLIGGSGRDVLSGNSGNDRLDGRTGRDTLTGGAGSDTLRGGQGSDSIDGSQGSDVLLGGGGPDTISGGDGSDRILGSAGRDMLDGDAGDDTLFGGFGADNIAGGLGDDTLNGVFRNDSFDQTVGPDRLFGGQRVAARPAPVTNSAAAPQMIPASSTARAASPQFSSPPTVNVSVEDIDDAFTSPLLPELLEL